MNVTAKNSLGYIIAELYPGYTIAAEQIPQGAKPPFFFVKQINQSYNKLIGDNSESIIDFDIAYFPAEGRSMRKEMEEVQLSLLRAFSSDNRLRLYRVNSSIVDDILHVQGLVRLRERKVNQEIKFSSLQADIKEV